MSDHVLFAVAPAVAILSCVVLWLIRIASGDSIIRRAAAAANSTQTGRRARAPMVLAWLLLAAGHVAIVVWPQAVLSWNRVTARRIAFEATLFVCGAAILVDLLRSVRRRLGHSTDPQPPGDAAFGAALLVAVVSGLGLAVLYRWASMWAAVTLAPFARSLVRLEPDIQLIAPMPYLVKLHLFCGVVLLALWPLRRWERSGLRWAGRRGRWAGGSNRGSSDEHAQRTHLMDPHVRGDDDRHLRCRLPAGGRGRGAARPNPGSRAVCHR
jgi:nitrate reductase gamma subunit